MVDLRVVLELEAGVVPCGRLVAAGGEGIRFAGWIELAAAVERVLVAVPSPDPPRAPGLSATGPPD